VIVTFDPEAHGYAIDGRPVPGIHEIGEALKLSPDSKFMPEEARTRGQYVHEAIEMDLMDKLDEASCAGLMGYVKAARLALLKEDLLIPEDPRNIEILVGNAGLSYATKIDALATKAGSDPVAVNWKSGAPEPFHALQSAAEVLCLPGAEWRRVAIYLEPNGKYTPVWFEDPRDFDTWRSACGLYDWLCRSHQSVRPRGVKPQEEGETIPFPAPGSTLFDPEAQARDQESWLDYQEDNL
jgi:hypothetical protein